MYSALFVLYLHGCVRRAQARSALPPTIRTAPDVRGGEWKRRWRGGALLSISKIDEKERQARQCVAATRRGGGEAERVRQKTTLKTICARIPSVSKSSGERVPVDRKTY